MNLNPATIVLGDALSVSDFNGRAVRPRSRALVLLGAPPAPKLKVATALRRVGRQGLSGCVELTTLRAQP